MRTWSARFGRTEVGDLVIRVLLDTNVLISATFWRGPSHRIWLAVRSRALRCYTSQVLLRELRSVLTARKGAFRLAADEAARISRHILRHCTVVRPRVRLAALEDDPDNRVLECAVAARCSVLVTGDAGFLALSRFRRIRILTPARFWAEIQGAPQATRRVRPRP